MGGLCMSKHDEEQDCLRIAEATRAACLAAALESYEEASIRGLCHEGAWECAIDAIRSLDINAILEQALPDSKDEAHQEPV